MSLNKIVDEYLIRKPICFAVSLNTNITWQINYTIWKLPSKFTIAHCMGWVGFSLDWRGGLEGIHGDSVYSRFCSSSLRQRGIRFGVRIGEIIVDIWRRDGNMYKLGIRLKNK